MGFVVINDDDNDDNDDKGVDGVDSSSSGKGGCSFVGAFICIRRSTYLIY